MGVWGLREPMDGERERYEERRKDERQGKRDRGSEEEIEEK